MNLVALSAALQFYSENGGLSVNGPVSYVHTYENGFQELISAQDACRGAEQMLSSYREASKVIHEMRDALEGMMRATRTADAWGAANDILRRVSNDYSVYSRNPRQR